MGCASTIPAIIYGCLVVWVTAVQAKECTNIPTQYASHTVRAVLHEKETANISAFLLPTTVSRRRISLERQENGSRDALVTIREGGRADGGPALALKEVSLHRVRLAPDSLHWVAQDTNLKYLLMLDVDRLVWSFRATAGLSAPGSPYGGWEEPTQELRGHYVGHYLSAAALMWASTREHALKEKMETLVDALGKCQDQIGTGYLSAFPSEFFDRFEEIKPVWAPYYTIHKIMAGLLDQYVHASSEKAMGILLWMARYFLNRVETVIRKYTIERHWETLNEEVGGMNDVLYRLYMHTGNPEHLKLAHLFDKPCFLGLLAVQSDGLSGFHSNTHIPLVVGAQMRFEATGDKLYADVSQYFLDIVSTSHSYATGGTSASEFWIDPNRNGDALATENQETCTTYNMLKIARNSFRWTKDVRYADYYEKTLVNGILGIQRGQEPGVMIYMLPQGPGTSKAVSYHGWGDPYNSFWCCYGSGTESFSKLGDSIYFEDVRDPLKLVVSQFVSSNLTWNKAGLLVIQNVVPLSSVDPYLHATFTFDDLPEGGGGKEAEVALRIPTWTEGKPKIQLNGLAMASPKPGTYFILSRLWRSGDVLRLDLRIPLLLEAVQDDRTQFSTLHAILFGPYLLAGMTDGDHDIGTKNMSSLSSWIKPVPSSYAAQLFTFSQDYSTMLPSGGQGVGGQVSVLSYRDDAVEMKVLPPKGTDSAAQCTFRLINSHKATSADSMVGSIVSFELYSQPGRLLAYAGPDRKLGAVDSEATWNQLVQTSEITILEEGDQRDAADDDWPRLQGGHNTFKVHGGLSGDSDAVSFEAATFRGCYMASDADGGVSLLCQSEGVGNETEFKSRASFKVSKGWATYNRVSFTAKGLNRQLLLFPIYAYQDETYATYFNVTSN